MNRGVALSLFTFLLVLCACERTAPKAATEKESVPLKFSEGETYREFKGTSGIRFISIDELEMIEGGQNIVCKYKREGQKIRVVQTVAGTPQAFYYDILPEGIRRQGGSILLSPSALARAEEDKRKADEEKRVAAEKRMQRLAVATTKKEIIKTFPIPKHEGKLTKVDVTDVSYIFTYEEGKMPIEETFIEALEPKAARYGGVEFPFIDRGSITVITEEALTKELVEAGTKARASWAAKFPEFVR